MKNFIHGKKDSEAAAPNIPADTSAQGAEQDTVDATEHDMSEIMSAEDVETEKLKNAIAQVMAEETAQLPHIEQLSMSVAKESGLMDNKDDSGEDKAQADAGDNAEADAELSVAAAVSVPEPQAKISSWFVTFMAMRIPIVGWIYLLYLAFSRKTKNRRNFARAYLLIKLIFLILGLIILFLVISMAMNILQDLLDYMAML